VKFFDVRTFAEYTEKKFKSTYWTMDYRNGKEKQKNKIGFRWLRFFFLLSWWGWSSRQPHPICTIV